MGAYANLPPPDLLLGPLGVSCTDCGAVLPDGAPPGHWCLEAADRRIAERVAALLGPHTPAMRAAVLHGAAQAAPLGERGDTVRAMMRWLRDTASELAALVGAAERKRPEGGGKP